MNTATSSSTSWESRSATLALLGCIDLAEVFALDRVLGPHEGEHRVRVLDHADAGAAVELLERVVVGVVRCGVSGRDGSVVDTRLLPGSLTLVSGTKLLPASGGQVTAAGSVRRRVGPGEEYSHV